MTREEMENFINAPLNMELYEKLKIIYDKGYQDCKKEIKDCKSISISDSQKKLIEIYNEINESENAVCYLTSDDSDVILSAFKALQEPCEDCISREQAKAEIRKAFPSLADRVDINSILNGLPSVKQEPKQGHCKNCRYFEYDSVAKVDGIPLIVAHEICSRWGDGCKTKEDGYCFLFESKNE